jgi:hypothetical protein
MAVWTDDPEQRPDARELAELERAPTRQPTPEEDALIRECFAEALGEPVRVGRQPPR